MFLHTGTFKLEGAVGIALLVKPVGFFIIQRYGIYLNSYTMILFDKVKRCF